MKIQELGLAIDDPSKNISQSILQELQVKKIDATSLYTIRQARGMELHGRLQGLMGTPGFDQLGLIEQKKMVKDTISESRTIVSQRARALLLNRQPVKLDELTAFPNLGGPPSQ
jgi:hypothetical protein